MTQRIIKSFIRTLLKSQEARIRGEVIEETKERVRKMKADPRKGENSYETDSDFILSEVLVILDKLTHSPDDQG